MAPALELSVTGMRLTDTTKQPSPTLVLSVGTWCFYKDFFIKVFHFPLHKRFKPTYPTQARL